MKRERCVGASAVSEETFYGRYGGSARKLYSRHQIWTKPTRFMCCRYFIGHYRLSGLFYATTFLTFWLISLFVSFPINKSVLQFRFRLNNVTLEWQNCFLISFHSSIILSENFVNLPTVISIFCSTVSLYRSSYRSPYPTATQSIFCFWCIFSAPRETYPTAHQICHPPHFLYIHLHFHNRGRPTVAGLTPALA